MEQCRATPRYRANEGGLIALDEHISVACMVHDQSLHGVRLTMLDTSFVPSAFTLAAACLGETQVCRVEWRTDKMIGAWFDRAAQW